MTNTTKQSAFMPNAFQVPNIYVDTFWSLLTPEEKDCLVYAMRRIFGFGKRRDRISLSQFCSGICSRSGERLDYGTGLGLAAVRTALAGLLHYGLMIQTAENDSKLNTGAEYELQLDEARVDLTGLLMRAGQRKNKNQAKTVKARKYADARRRQPGLLDRPPIVGQTPPHTVRQTPPPTVRQKHNKQDKQGNTDSLLELDAISNLTIPQAMKLPELALFQKVTKRLPGQPQWEMIVRFMREKQPDEATMQKCWDTWIEAGFRAQNLAWLIDWTVNGIPKVKKPNGNGTRPASGQAASALRKYHEKLEQGQ